MAPTADHSIAFAQGAAFVARNDRMAHTTHTTMNEISTGWKDTSRSPFANSEENTVKPTTPATVTATAVHTFRVT